MDMQTTPNTNDQDAGDEVNAYGNFSATYSPDDNKLRLYSVCRLDEATYKAARDLGFRYAPKQQLFVAPAWSPAREDFLLSLCGEIGDEDTSLVERAEDRPLQRLLGASR